MAVVRQGGGQDAVDRLLAEARAGKPRPVYLLAGESFDTHAAARALVDVLVPQARRAFNLEVYDGRTTPLSTVLDSLRTPGFLAGVKVIWVREAPLFVPGDKRGDLCAGLFDDWAAGREVEAAEKMLTLVALCGWTQRQLDETTWSSAPAAKVREVFGEALSAEQRQVLDAVRAAARSRDLRVAEHQDESAALLAYLDAGPLPGSVLVFTSSAVDGRKKLVRRIGEVGAFVTLVADRERSGALTRQSVEELIERLVAERGKRIDAAAREQIVRRAGSDPACLASELEKLCLYAGARPVIGEDDVRAVFIDMAESWIFDLTAALAARRLGAALAVLKRLFEQGEPPLRLVAMMAREVRLLLVARECLESRLRGFWQQGIAYNVFQSKVMPHLDEASKRAFGNAHPFVLFRRFQDAAAIRAPVLREALMRLSALDLQLKSSAGNPRLLVEAFVLDWCRDFRSPAAAAV